ncbi:acetyltransferase (GNAT) family protein [Pontibacter mucosus]|uniref:Acetyltransferase (GNAT) family protein n=1 Tax=Pontibacter mucosus TaxID=1649266 RepID=A0A2T5YT03_9BACT|nr:GNAT family N-acetyltransferase [Pontibacter mucosus]PTX22440.1 acetyltransferase (GNAT) family protein [Pontibacter mucosus]
MNFLRLTDTSHSHFGQAWALYEQAFPLEERRPLAWQRDIMPHAPYHFELILQEEALVGILLWWGFEEVRYIEHLATAPAQRGRGYGKRILESFTNRDARPILLEVEPPREEIQQRRIRFYEQGGFTLNHHFYQQPPYHPGLQPLTLLLMSFPEPLTPEAVAHFVNTRHPLIYRLHTSPATT